MAKKQKTQLKHFTTVRRSTQYGGKQMTLRVEVLSVGENSMLRTACSAVVREGSLYSTRKVKWEEPLRARMPYGFKEADPKVLEVMREWCSTGKAPESLWTLPS